MATKTFNIGESAVGGRIKVDMFRDTIDIKVLDWTTRKTIFHHVYFAYGTFHSITDWLEDVTTVYYAGKIVEWIESKRGRDL
jgi:hypothetical protein